MRTKLLSTVLLGGATLLAAGCASSTSTSSRPVYSTGQVGQVMSSDAGMVTNVEEVLIQASSTYPGAPGTGAQVGSAAGRAILSGNPAVAAAGAIGGILGGKAGANMDNRVGDKITVALDSGKTITIVQPRDKQPIMPGERVVIESGTGSSKAKVTRENPVKDSNYAIRPATGW